MTLQGRKALYRSTLWAWGQVSRPLPRRGLGRLAERLNFLLEGSDVVEVPVGRGRMIVPLSDPYYAALIARAGAYEPEVENFIRAALPHFDCFIDGGANFGYWSIFVGTQRDRNRTVVAVEPNSRNFNLLSGNCSLNDDAFVPLHAAITDVDGAPVNVDTDRLDHHAIGRVVAAQVGDSECQTVTIDSIVESHGLASERTLVKLDVEGYEVSAMAGGSLSISEGATVLFEDHGLDIKCAATVAALDLGLSVYLLTERGVLPIRNPRTLAARKLSSVRGYNLVGGHEGSQMMWAMQGYI